MADRTKDIERYLRGEMTPAEMNALEKSALNDPFLADALEGLETVPKETFSADLSWLEAAIQQRTEETKQIISLWGWTWRIAAGLLLIAISTYFIFTISNQETKSNLALNKPVEPLQPDTKTTAPADVTAEPEAAAQPTIPEAKDEPREPQHTTGAENKVLKEDVVIAQEQVPETEANAPTTEISSNDYTPMIDSVVVVAKTPNDGYFAKPQTEIIESEKEKVNPITGAAADKKTAASKIALKKERLIKGHVTDAEDGTGMPGVNVTVKGTNIATSTDINGDYEISVDKPQADLVFSFIGYNNQEIPIENKDSVEVAMTADYAALSEVVVVGYASLRSELDDPNNVYTYAEPKGGRKAYRDYLVHNMLYPEEAITHKAEGKVTVQFAIEPDGAIGEFKVLKTPGYGCENEVIRLIKEGPKWSPSTRNNTPVKGKVKVRLRFTLPK